MDLPRKEDLAERPRRKTETYEVFNFEHETENHEEISPTKARSILKETDEIRKHFNDISKRKASTDFEVAVRRASSDFTRETKEEKKEEVEKEENENDPKNYHTVHVTVDDTLHSLAFQYSVSPAVIKEFNNFSGDIIYPGQVQRARL